MKRKESKWRFSHEQNFWYRNYTSGILCSSTLFSTTKIIRNDSDPFWNLFSLVKNFLVVSTRYLRKYSVRQRFSHFRDHVIHFYKLHFLKLILSNQNESFLVESNVTNRKSGIQVCLKWNFEKISTPKMPISNSDHVLKMLTWSYHALCKAISLLY